jgi:DUF4097 and DUF4098 domain-containing protein YvlB
MNIVSTLVIATLALSPVTAAAQSPTTPAREQTRDAARERAREQAERMREAQRAQRERQAQQRRQRLDAERGPEFTEPFSRTIRLGRSGSFQLSNVAGEVLITGGGGDDVKIEAVKRVRARTEQDARALFEQIEILVAQRSNQVEVRTEMRVRRGWSGGVDYTVALPENTSVEVNTVSGTVRVTNVRGELRTGSVSGDVRVASSARLLSARTVSGTIQLVDTQGQDVTLGAVSGDIDARNLKARSVLSEGVSGSIRFGGAEIERVSLKTISGDIEYAGRLLKNGRYEMQSQSGDLRVAPSGNDGFDVDANSFSGNISSDYAFNGVQPAGRRGPGRALRGKTGDGSAVLTLRSFSGDISIAKR